MTLSWNEVRRREFAKVPKGSPFKDYQKAMVRAGEIYRGVAQPAEPRRRRNPDSARNNPSNSDVVMLAIVGAGLYFGYQYVKDHPDLFGPPAQTAALP